MRKIKAQIAFTEQRLLQAIADGARPSYGAVVNSFYAYIPVDKRFTDAVTEATSRPINSIMAKLDALKEQEQSNADNLLS